MSFGRHKRTDIFILRIWSEDTEVENAVDEGVDCKEAAISKLEWRGKLQRAVDGEAHQFDSWQGLVDLLQAMISNNKGR